MKKNWRVKNLETNSLQDLAEYPNLIAKLLALRGFSERGQIEDFLKPEYAKLHNPFLFVDMEKAVTRIRQAVANQEKICIYADYDADAITAASVVFLGLKQLGITADCYIPDRFAEGYGMNLDAIRSLAANHTKLIITVDCGINAVEETLLAKNLGIDVIITDHHELTGEVPEAYALINPKNPNDKYPFPFLTGVGVAYKLMQALDLQGQEKWLLDLVAIGTVADCQSLSDENRILVSYGLKVLAKTKNIGLKALLQSAGLKNNQFDTFTLGFILAPRINAAGRIKHGDTAYKLLICDDPAEAQKLAQELNDLNKHRQSLTEQILSEAKEQAERSVDKKVILAVGDWPKGVVGLVAGKLVEQYQRPALAISSMEGLATGSARSIPSFDMVAALGFAKDLLQKYGGHTQAAGFTLASENLPSFHQRLLEYAESLNLPMSQAELEIDAEIMATEITWDVFQHLEKFEPFGYGNSKPKFLGLGMEVLDCRPVGNANKHAKLKLRFGEQILEAIAFGQGFLLNTIRPGQKIDAVFELTANEWNGNRVLQLKIIDIKIND